MGAKLDMCMAVLNAGGKPTYDELRETLVEVLQECTSAQLVANDLGYLLNTLASAHAENDGGAVYDILDTYIKHRRSASAQAKSGMH